MRQIIIFLMALCLFASINGYAQLKPAQSQYLVEKGVLINPSFEQGYKGWVITGCTKSLVTETPYLDKSLKLTCVNETFSIKQVSTSLIDFKNQQGAYDIQVKSTASGVNIASITNGVRDNSYTVVSDTTFKRFKEIGFIIGDTDNGIEVYSDVNFTGEIIVDNFKVGLGNLTQEIQGAHFVGSLNYNSTDCLWSSNLTPFQDFPVDAECIAQNIEGNVAAPDTKIPAIKILNARTDGYYKVVFTGVYGENTGNIGYVALSDFSGQNTEQSITYIQDTKTNYNNSAFGNFRFSVVGDATIRLVAQVGAGAMSLYARNSNEIAKFTVHFFPDSKNTIVSQDTELTAKTANVCNMAVDAVNNTIISQDVGCADGITITGGAGVINVNFPVGTYGVIPTGQCLSSNRPPSTAVLCYEGSGTTAKTLTVYPFQIRNPTNLAVGDSGLVNLQFNKQGADVNKSQTIVGSFEQIETVTGDLTAETANEFTGNIANDKATLTRENFNIMTCSSLGLGTGACVYTNASLFATDPVVNVSLNDSSGSCHEIRPYNSTKLGFNYTAFTATGAGNDCAVSFTVTRGEDYNKSFKGAVINAADSSQLIADTIRAEIVSDDLTRVTASGNNGQTVTGLTEDIEYGFTSETDPLNSWDGSGFTAPKTSSYLIAGGLRSIASNLTLIRFHVDGIFRRYVIDDTGLNDRLFYSTIVKLNAGERLSFRSNVSFTSATSDATTSYIEITELPDRQSILENFNNANTTKCQTKYLSANTSSTGNISDLTFNNMVIGKKYSIVGQVVGSANHDTRVRHNSINIAQTYNASASSYGAVNTGVFTATVTTALLYKANAVQVNGNGGSGLTWLQLCEEPDTTIFTTEFN